MPPARPRFAARKPGQPSVGRRRGVAAAGGGPESEPAALMNESEISELMGSVLGVEVAINRADPLGSSGPAPLVVAAFVDDEGELGAIIVVELAAAASLAAALTSAEVSMRSDAISAGVLEGELLEDFTEVAKVCAQLVRLPGATTLTLSEVTQSATGVTQSAQTLMGDAAMRVGWTTSVPGYGGGKFTAMWAPIE